MSDTGRTQQEMHTMNQIAANIEAYESALLAVKQHCMCARFEDLGGAYRVLYAPGFQLDGVQAVYQNCGKRVALERILNAMERHWLAS